MYCGCLSGHCSRRLCADSNCHFNLARSTVDGAAHGHHICLSIIRSSEDQKSRCDPDCSFTQGKALQQESAQRKGMLKNMQNYEKVKISPPEMLRPLQIDNLFLFEMIKYNTFLGWCFLIPVEQNEISIASIAVQRVATSARLFMNEMKRSARSRV